MIPKITLFVLVVPVVLAGCEASIFASNEPKVIARNSDSFFGASSGPTLGKAARAVTPDGCEAWIIDDGLEGYAATRSNPRTGLPVCNSEFAPGSVIGDYNSSSDIPDFLP